ncbi:MAG TPA: ATP-binding cassette domain-containing protein [Conexibacter sp.]|nr:ATP-binding cassette domain-containing protein [Conexibacter sp.]
MSLLALEGVTKRARLGRRERLVLKHATLRVEAGELVSIWGVPRSGRTTLLRVASGLEAPDAGVVRFAGRDLAERHGDWLDEGIGFAQPDRVSVAGQAVADYVAMGLLAGGVAPQEARARALEQLDRTGAAACAPLPPQELDATELVRVALAQALARGPRLLVVDDPTRNVDPLERQSVLALLRSIADDGVAVLMTTGEALGVAGVDRALAISDGELRTEVVPAQAPVVPLRGSGTGG